LTLRNAWIKRNEETGEFIKQNLPKISVKTKKCSICEKEKDASFFTIDKQKRDGLRSSCLECSKLNNYTSILDGTKKVCPSCKQEKEKTEFSLAKNSKDGLQIYCKLCCVEKNQKKKYGIDFDDYKRMYEKQKGLCAICNNPIGFRHRDTHVDHCHKSSKVRGLLCYLCNLGLGTFRDNTTYLQMAIKYLRRHISE
jgi:hypothetical protein